MRRAFPPLVAALRQLDFPQESTMRRVRSIVFAVLVSLWVAGLMIPAAPARAQEGEEPPASHPEIVFFSDRDGDQEIYVMDVGGSNVTNLTNSPGADRFPTWSPDGTRIAFHSERDGNFEIYVMDADGGNVTRLTFHPARDQFPTWSPDGDQILFTSTRDGNFELYVMDANGENQLRLTETPDVPEFGPIWSPDAVWIAFGSERQERGNLDVYVAEVGQERVRRLTWDEFDEQPYDWSPDSQQILFRARSETGKDILVMDVNGTHKTPLIADPALDEDMPDWSPDGTQIVYVVTIDGQDDIFVLDAEGRAHNLTRDPGQDRAPDWRPVMPGLSADEVSDGEDGETGETGDGADGEGDEVGEGEEVEGVCVVIAGGTGVNLRTGPGTNYERAGGLTAGERAEVDGRAGGTDGYRWYRLAESGMWVREDVVTVAESCRQVPVVQP
jgi:Tol biopolymer transport system component